MRHLIRAILALALMVSSPALVTTIPMAMAQSNLIDINMASKAELDTLKGIGPVHAEAIIKNRPYKGKDELWQRKIITRKVYDEIKDKIIAKQKT
jgi:competence protein ComEA